MPKFLLQKMGRVEARDGRSRRIQKNTHLLVVLCVLLCEACGGAGGWVGWSGGAAAAAAAVAAVAAAAAAAAAAVAAAAAAAAAAADTTTTTTTQFRMPWMLLHPDLLSFQSAPEFAHDLGITPFGAKKALRLRDQHRA